jgi:TonB family protein
MSILFDDARLSERPRGRSTTGLWLSVVLHAIAAVILIVVPIRASEKPSAPRMQSRIVFILPATEPVRLPLAPVVTPRLPAPPARPRPVSELARAEVPKPLPFAPIVAKPAPAPLVPAATPAIERPIEKPETQRPLEIGLFEQTSSARTSQAAAAVTTGGFGSAATSPRDAANGSGAVKTGGFSSEAPAPRRTANGSGEVQKAGFDPRASAPAQPSVAATKPLDRPVEIVFKPTPEYTDDARSARIEGTVSLELEFTAAGDVRVLRVVRGLGHGLDEAAHRAALRIRFKPAKSDGRPVDSRATVHITFRLS